MADLIDSDYEGETNSQSAVVYNIPDLKAMAAKILRRANEVAQQKIASAQQSIAQMEKKAVEEGKVKGLEEGRQAGEQQGLVAGEQAARNEFNEKIGSISTALQVVLKEVAARKVALHAEAETDLLRLAIDIAKRIVRREVEVDEQFVVPIVREAIGLTNNRSDLIVRLNPSDVEAVELELPALHAIFSDLGRIEVKSDTTVERGGARVQSREGEVDMRLSQQFDALERALVGDTEGLQIKPLSAYSAKELAVTNAPAVSAAGGVGEEQATVADVDVKEVLSQIENKEDTVAESVKTTSEQAASQDNSDQKSGQQNLSTDSRAVTGQPDSGVTVANSFSQAQAEVSGALSALDGLSSLDEIPLDSATSNLIDQTLGESSPQAGGGA